MGKLMSRWYQQPLLTNFEDIRGRWIDRRWIDIWWGYSSWLVRLLQPLHRSYCTAASGFSDATAPGLTATSALTTWTTYFNDLWMNNWSGLYFCGVKFTGFRSQLGVLLPNICQLIPPALLLAKISGQDLRLFTKLNSQTVSRCC